MLLRPIPPKVCAVAAKETNRDRPPLIGRAHDTPPQGRPMVRRKRMAMVRPFVADNITLWVHIIVCNYKILPNISTPPIFAAEIERGRVAKADGCCLRQARPEVQGITLSPIFVLSRPTPPPRVSAEKPDSPPPGCQHPSLPPFSHTAAGVPRRLWSDGNSGEKG